MGISANVRALLALSGKKQSELLELLHMSSRQSLSNKFKNERWSAEDLTTVAALCGCKLAFVLPDGQHIFLDVEADKESPDA